MSFFFFFFGKIKLKNKMNDLSLLTDQAQLLIQEAIILFQMKPDCGAQDFVNFLKTFSNEILNRKNIEKFENDHFTAFESYSQESLYEILTILTECQSEEIARLKNTNSFLKSDNKSRIASTDYKDNIQYVENLSDTAKAAFENYYKDYYYRLSLARILNDLSDILTHIKEELPKSFVVEASSSKVSTHSSIIIQNDPINDFVCIPPFNDFIVNLNIERDEYIEEFEKNNNFPSDLDEEEEEKADSSIIVETPICQEEEDLEDPEIIQEALHFQIDEKQINSLQDNNQTQEQNDEIVESKIDNKETNEDQIIDVRSSEIQNQEEKQRQEEEAKERQRQEEEAKERQRQEEEAAKERQRQEEEAAKERQRQEEAAAKEKQRLLEKLRENYQQKYVDLEKYYKDQYEKEQLEFNDKINQRNREKMTKKENLEQILNEKQTLLKRVNMLNKELKESQEQLLKQAQIIKLGEKDDKIKMAKILLSFLIRRSASKNAYDDPKSSIRTLIVNYAIQIQKDLGLY